jgi:hypothetical protein
MKKVRLNYFLLALLLLINFGVQVHAQEKKLPVIPQPQEVIFYDATFNINPNTKIVLGAGSQAADRFTAAQLNERLFELAGIQLKIFKEEEITNWVDVLFFGKLDKSPKAKQIAKNANFALITEIGQEGYFLQSTDSLIAITANSSTGLYYGCMTLNQLVHKSHEQLQVEGITIYDWPDLQFRGISDDISRGQISKMENFKEIIRFISQYKMNTYMPYIEDVFRFKNHPKIGEGRGALTKEEVAELDAFAKKYHVQIIPIFETLGHMENILRIPDYRDLAEFPGSTTITPAKEETYRFLDELIFEISEAFSSPYLHIGGDESQQLGWGASKSLVEMNGLATVHAQHYKRVFEIAKSYGKQVMMYADMILANPTILNQIPDEIILIDWQYRARDNYPSVEALQKSGRKFIVSPGLWNWLRIFPDYLESFSNIKNLIQRGYEAGALGAITSNWNDLGGATFREYNWYGYAFAAECSWSPAKVDIDDFNNNFFPQFFGTRAIEPELIYTLLMDLGDQTLWHEVWQHPFLPLKKSNRPLHKRILNLKVKMPLVLSLIDSLSKKAVRNKNHLDYLKFAAEQGLWLVKKYETSNQIEQITKMIYKNPDNHGVDQITEKSLELVEDLNAIIENLQLLWLRNYRQEGLPRLLDLYNLQIDYLQEKIDQIQLGDFLDDPQLESQWIYHPVWDSEFNEVTVPHAYYRKTFDVKPGFKKANLQAIADSYLKIYLNGGFLDEVIDSRTLSLEAESQRVKLWDITALLQPGKNVIAVEAWNYRPNSSAGVNIYGEIEYELGRTEKILSNAYWKTSTQEERNWRKLGFFDVQWLNAVPRERGLVITKPNFKSQRPSRIQW